jgi:hypothetical protein
MINLGFLLRENLAAIFIIPSSWGSQRAGHLPGITAVLFTPSLGDSNWSVIYVNTAPSTSFMAPLPGRKKTFVRGVLHAQSFTLFLVLLYFIFACII